MIVKTVEISRQLMLKIVYCIEIFFQRSKKKKRFPEKLLRCEEYINKGQSPE